jgi:hypothetical protein
MASAGSLRCTTTPEKYDLVVAGEDARTVKLVDEAIDVPAIRVPSI